MAYMDRITQLEAFVRLVERGSFSGVAEELRVQQSTVSKWIGALEAEVGRTLIERTTRSQRVTEAGQRFYLRAQAILDEYEQAMGEARQVDRGLRGRVRVSLPTVFGRLYVVPLLTTLLQEHPELEVDMVLGDRYVNLVEDGFDLAVRVGVQVDSTMRLHPLGSTPRRVVAAPGYLERHGKPVTPRDLERHECLVHASPGAKTLWRFTRNGRSLQTTVRGRASINHSEATLMLAREGLGVAMLASWLVDPDIETGRLVSLLSDYQPPHAPFRALTPPGRHLTTRVRQTLEHLREGLAPLGQSPELT